MQPKLKIVFSFYGIATSLDVSSYCLQLKFVWFWLTWFESQSLQDTYDARMPSLYTNWVRDTFRWARVDWSSLVLPSECTPFTTTGSSFRAWLLVKGLAPLLVICMAMMGATSIKCVRLGWTAKTARSGMFQAVPLVLFLSFCLVPSVSATIFESWLCVEYQDDGSSLYQKDGSHASSISMRSFMRSDLRVQCSEHGFSDAEHNKITAIATALVAVWPVGFVAMYVLALLPCRSSLRDHLQTPLVRATRFLHRE